MRQIWMMIIVGLTIVLGIGGLMVSATNSLKQAVKVRTERLEEKRQAKAREAALKQAKETLDSVRTPPTGGPDTPVSSPPPSYKDNPDGPPMEGGSSVPPNPGPDATPSDTPSTNQPAPSQVELEQRREAIPIENRCQTCDGYGYVGGNLCSACNGTGRRSE